MSIIRRYPNIGKDEKKLLKSVQLESKLIRKILKSLQLESKLIRKNINLFADEVKKYVGKLVTYNQEIKNSLYNLTKQLVQYLIIELERERFLIKNPKSISEKGQYNLYTADDVLKSFWDFQFTISNYIANEKKHDVIEKINKFNQFFYFIYEPIDKKALDGNRGVKQFFLQIENLTNKISELNSSELEPTSSKQNEILKLNNNKSKASVFNHKGDVVVLKLLSEKGIQERNLIQNLVTRINLNPKSKEAFTGIVEYRNEKGEEIIRI